MEYMAELSGKSEEELAADLSGVIFRDIQCAEEAAVIPKAFVQVEQFPFVAADEYLSGNVRRKLRMAKTLYEVLPAEKKPLIVKNIEALEAVQPVDLTAAEIGVRIGANWIPIDVYQNLWWRPSAPAITQEAALKSCAPALPVNGPLPRKCRQGQYQNTDHLRHQADECLSDSGADLEPAGCACV